MKACTVNRELRRRTRRVVTIVLLLCMSGCQLPQHLFSGKVARSSNPPSPVDRRSDTTASPSASNSLQLAEYTQPARHSQSDSEVDNRQKEDAGLPTPGN